MTIDEHPPDGIPVADCHAPRTGDDDRPHNGPRTGRPSVSATTPGDGDGGDHAATGSYRTPLGRRLARQRRAILDSGLPVLNWDQIEREVAEGRAERPERDRT